MTSTRLWLIHPFDLYLLTKIDLVDIDHFIVEFAGDRKKDEDRLRYPYVGHKLRIHHLRQWGLKEFDAKTGRRKARADKAHTSFDLVLPDM